ncbi:translation initiation factor IF-2 [Dethiobacter alkaliphilus]|uniref:Translation initiation factor IF-2 n=1 Tax=Dethiobacter alkaliphilus AHT 1 TaxID=555088 RepID=C0GIV8_DETAL|nr:translation initiation factor IF-2 [Dethiobacter alkaliphilus]EEG76772.1 translation initiation factor IF-2 [Dethiobacter alkaliphilus AHT 1]
MGKTRVYELAKRLDVPSKRIIDLLADIGFEVKNHMSVVDEEAVKRITYQLTGKGEAPATQPPAQAQKQKENKPQPPKKDGGKAPKAAEAKKAQGAGAQKDQPRKKTENKPQAKPQAKPQQQRGPKSAAPGQGPRDKKQKQQRRGKKRVDKRERKARREARLLSEQERQERTVVLEGRITVGELADKMGVSASDVISKLIGLGVMATINQAVDTDIAKMLAEEQGFEVEVKVDTLEEKLVETEEDKEEDLRPRPPVVTILGHVDHGKTSLLDAIREANVTSQEAGGITQHIGAYQAEYNDKKIVFLDTPGHEAFTAMRARGAQVTDIAIVVVAADDGVMPQTVEAINHVKAADVPIIIAVNKIDKPNANPDRVKQQLAEYELIPEDWGGDTVFVDVSALKHTGLDTLMEMILLVSEMAELKANPDKPALGTVVEAKLDKGRGPVATVLIQDGTIEVGDSIICGTIYGKVRAMVDDRGNRIEKAGPATPVEILGLNDVAEAGDMLQVVTDDKMARQISEKRSDKRREVELKKSAKVSLDDLFSQIQEGERKDLNIIAKADVQGSVEALRESLLKLSNDEVRVQVIHGGVGAVTESDVMLASASDAIIIGFNVRPEPSARKMAEREDVELRLYRVIYEALEDVKAAMTGMLAPEFKEVVLGQAEVRHLFKVSRLGTIAGCHVLEGKITRNADVRVIRDGIVIHEGKMDTLKRFKDDVREVQTGYDCGILLEKFNDYKEGDIVEAYTMEQVQPA